MAGPWEAYEPSALRVPLRGPFGQLCAAEAGKMRDAETELLRTALLSRLPARCPVDALDRVGEVLRIPRYAAETDASYRGRLEVAWSTWEKAGSDDGIEDQIRAMGIQSVRVYPIWEMDFGPSPLAAYSEFWILIGPDLGTWGGTSDEVRALKRLVLKWKATHGYPVEIIAIDDTTSILGFASLGAAVLGGSTSWRYRIGRTLNGSLDPLGDPTCILGGYDLT